LLANFAFGKIVAVLNKDLKLFDAYKKDKPVYLKKGSRIYIRDKITSKRGITWYKTKDGYVNSKYVSFIIINSKPSFDLNTSNTTNNTTFTNTSNALKPSFDLNISNQSNTSDDTQFTNTSNTSNISLPNTGE